MLPIIRNTNLWPRFVDEFFGRDLLSDSFDNRTGISMPAVNIIEGKEDFTIEVATPGLKKDDFKICVENNIMTISSEKEEKQEEKVEHFVRREFTYASFCRTFSLPNTVEVDKIKASHNDGVLSINIPKKEEARVKPPKQISIR
ncbi:MAG: Hsp20/alpha crystallin family protein [Bacteroidetes bacterium]|nr:Hsp20/alpha crystallin family protein [Bacteroidota bacterium]